MNNEKYIWDFFKSKGLNDFGVAGLMGNLYAESKLDPQNLQQTSNQSLNMTDEEYTKRVDDGTYTNFVRDSGGYGLAQWTYYKRKQKLLDFAKSKRASIGNLEMQLEFLYKELSESYKGVLSVLQRAKSVLEASNKVLLNFEKPKDQGLSVQSKRASYGNSYYLKYNSNTAIMYTIADLHLRTGAGTTWQSLGVMPKNSMVTVLGKENNGWYQVSSCALQKVGYCSSNYLK